MRRHDAVFVEQIGHQQVVHVAAVAGHVHHFMPGRDLLEGIKMVDLDAVIKFGPYRFQQERDRAHRRVRVVGGNFPGVVARTAFGLFDR